VTKNEIIALTLREIGLPRLPKHQVPFSDEPDYEELVISELQSVLPDTDIKACKEFAYLTVTCCEICHECYPHYDMNLLELPSGETAWVCCSVKHALAEQSATHRTSERTNQ